jgi:hypothetical protein
MDTTRRSIRGTVVELRGKVGEAMDWRTYVGLYPLASLGAAMVGSALIGRWLGAMVQERFDGGAALTEGMSQAGSHGLGSTRTGGGTSHDSGPRPTSQSWARATSRLEDIVNRLIDVAGDTIERVLLPTLMDGFARLLGGDRAPSRSLVDAERRHGTEAQRASASI